MSQQDRNAELVALLETDFVGRNEPNYALANSISTILALPGLRAFYPMSIPGIAGQAQDLQSLGNHLTLNGNPQFGYENLIPYCQYDGTGDYHDIADAASGNAFDVLGTESYIEVAERGLTLGTWVKPEETGTGEALMAKFGAVGNQSYRIQLTVPDQLIFQISDDGTAVATATSVAIPTFNVWYYVVGRFRPGVFVDIFVNGVEVNVATAMVSIFNSTANFTIGARQAGADPFQGRLSMMWVCAAQLSDSIIQNCFHQMRNMYNV